MKRTPIKRSGWIKRFTRLKPVNRARRKKLYERNFGDYADTIRALPCFICRKYPPSDPAHVKSRGAGGDKTSLVPMCRYHHDLQGDMGTPEFQRVYRVDLVAEAARLWKQNGEGL